MKRITLVVLGILVGCFGASGQGTGTIVGTITDPSARVLPSAKVTATEEGTRFSKFAYTNSAGTYTLLSLRPTRYKLTVEASGFRTHEQGGVTLQADQTLTVNVSLQLGEISQIITVEAHGEQVDTQTGTLRQVIEQRRMVELPLNGRNAMQLTTLVAGSVGVGQTGAVHDSTFPATVTVSTNGSRVNQVSYNLDGGNQTDSFTNVNLPFPFPDALQEFSVQTSNYSAQSGTNSGAVVDVITKSGTNSLHGNMFGFLRNRVFNARNSFANLRDPLTRTQYGFTLGGPVRLPGYNGRDRTFFFGGYQGTRFNTASQTSTAFVPTDANRTGDFSALLNASDPNNPVGRAIQIVDPLNLQPFPGNVIPTSRLDPASLAALKYVPRAGGNGWLQYAVPTTQSFDEYLIKVDHSVGNHDRISFRYFFDQFSQPPVFVGSNMLTARNGNLKKVHNAVISDSHMFSPTLINDFRFTYGRRFSQLQNPIPFTPRDLGVKVNLPAPPYDKIVRIYVPGYFYAIVSPNSVFPTNDFTWADDLKWVRGRHTLAFGGNFQRTRYDQTAGDNTGSYDFTSDVTNYGIASFMVGKLRNFDQGAPGLVNLRNNFAGVYAEEVFRATKRITLTFGLRWDPGIVFDETRGRIVTFRPDAYYSGERSQQFVKAPPGLFFRGDRGILPNSVKSDWNNLAPRFGFAWDPFGEGKTSVRGGGGVFYSQRNGSIAMAYAGRTPPFSPGIEFAEPPGPFSDPYRGVTNPVPFPPPTQDVDFSPPITLRVYEPGVKLTTPVVYNWNFTIEHALFPDWLGRIAYVGAHGSHIGHSLELNSAVYVPGSTLGTQARRPFQSFGSIGMNSQEVNSSYNALQLSLEKRIGNGSSVLNPLTILANYTYSKSIDTGAAGANVAQVSGGGNSRPVGDPLRRGWDRGPSDFDFTHRIVASYVWDLPRLRGADRWVQVFLGDWGLTGIFTAQTGAALTVVAGQDRSKTALNADRVNYLGGNPLGAGACPATAIRCIDYLNKSTFALPAVGEFGNVGRGIIRGPNSWNWDMGILKNFPIREQFRVEFRWEFFNVFNHANWGNPSTNFSDGGFGRIQSVGSPRISQLSLKVAF